MRCVLQRVLSASVEVEGEVVGAIGPGLLCLVGIAADDTDKDAEWLARKLLRCRAFSSGEGKAWDQDVVGAGYDILKAMPPDGARAFYEAFLQRLRGMYSPEKISDGRFGAMMKVALVNDGPVTFTFDSRARDTSSGSSGSLSAAGAGGGE